MEKGRFVQHFPGETKKCRPGGRVVDQPLLPAPHSAECKPLTEDAGSIEGVHLCSML